MCKKAFSIVLMLAMVFAVPAYQAFAAEDDYEDMDVYDLKVKIIQLEENLYNVGEMVKDLTFNVQENQALAEIVKEMSFQFKKSQGDLHSIVSLQDRIERDVIPQMISIQSTVASVSASLNEKIKALGIRVYDTESSIQQLSARLKSNEDRLRDLDGIDDYVRSLNERLYSVEKKLEMGAPGPDDMGNNDGGTVSDEVIEMIAELDGKVGMLSVKLQGLQGTQDSVDVMIGQLFDVEAQVAAIGDSIGNVEFSLSGLNSRLGSLEATQTTFATFDELGEVQSQVDSLNAELQKARSASSTNFLIGILALLSGVGALALVLL